MNKTEIENYGSTKHKKCHCKQNCNCKPHNLARGLHPKSLHPQSSFNPALELIQKCDSFNECTIFLHASVATFSTLHNLQTLQLLHSSLCTFLPPLYPS